MIDRSVDQFVVEECTDVAAKLCIPFGARRGGICSALCRDGGVSERRIERLAGALHHQHAVIVYAEMVAIRSGRDALVTAYRRRTVSATQFFRARSRAAGA